LAPASAVPSPSDKPSAVTGISSEIRIAANTAANATTNFAKNVAAKFEPETRKPDSPFLVKPDTKQTKTLATSEEPAPQPPSSLEIASANASNLSSVVSSAPSSAPKLSHTTLKISQGVSKGLLIKQVQPKYPAAALAVHAQGAVQIEATIDKEGNVISPKVLKGDPILGRAALEAVRQWRYKPYYLDGQPVEIQTQITVNFKVE